MSVEVAAVTAFGDRLAALDWVTDLWIAGSSATGDYVPGVSDLDLVAIVEGRVGPRRQLTLTSLHNELDGGIAAGTDLGCQYVDESLVDDRRALHPTWTHGRLLQRPLSCITRAELVRCGSAVLGRRPTDLLAAMTDDDLREAARAEICGYWAWVSRRPWMWLDPGIADLGLSGMAHARYTLRTGRLLTKTEAIEQVEGPAWLIDQLRARRRGETVSSPRARTGWIAWRNARETLTWASRGARQHGG